MTIASAAGHRIAAIDIARGVALAGMVVFHGAWDLRHFGLIELDPSRSVGWLAFGHAVAATFLFLSGLSLVLADRRGADAASHLKRLAVVSGAAALVTGTTWLAVPRDVVLFGILHCIALSNAIALCLLRAPLAVLVGLAVLGLVLPWWAAGTLPDILWWIGLSDRIPDTLDYRPLLPWLGPTLLGVVIGRSWTKLRWPAAISAPMGSFLALLGRHSLSVYLLHQPVLFACLTALTTFLPDRVAIPAIRLDAVEQAAYLGSCKADCGQQGADQALCGAICRCVLERHLARSATTKPTSSTSADVSACLRQSPMRPGGAKL